MQKHSTNWLGLLITILLLEALLSPAFASTAMKQSHLHKKSPGELHNEGMKFILERIKVMPKPGDRKRLVISLANRYLESIGEAPVKMDSPNPPRNYDEAISGIRNINGSDTLKSAFKSVLKLERRNPKLAALDRALVKLERETAPRLKGDELDRFSHAVSIARASARFWAPSEQGGVNGMKYFHPKGGFNPPPVEFPIADSAGCMFCSEQTGLVGCVFCGLVCSAIDMMF